MADPFHDYRELLLRNLLQARQQVFGDPEQVAKAEGSREELSVLARRPVRFAREYLGERTVPASRAILRALIKHLRVHVSGCRKSMKSHTGAQATLAMTCTAPTRTIVTAATYTQVRENTFARIRQMHAHARKPLPGRMGVTSLRISPTWYAIGISTNKPGNIQGFHGDVNLPPALEFDDEMIDEDSLLAPDPELADEDNRRSERDAGEVIDEEVWKSKRENARLFFLLDEMAEMRPDIVETMAGSWMGDNVFVLSQFNPTFQPDSKHPAARFLREDSGFYRVHIAGREPPEEMHPPDLFDVCFHSVPKPVMPDAWVAERLADWGPNSAMTCCHVYGLPAAIDRERQFIPFRLIRDSWAFTIKDPGRSRDRHIGWDVAASTGGDYNVVSLWVSGVLTSQEKWHCPDTLESADRVLELRVKWSVGGEIIPGRNLHVDKIGVGDGPVAYLRRKGIQVDAVDVGASPQHDWDSLTGETEFFNRKSELLWIFRRALQEGIAQVPREFSDVVRQAQWYTHVDAPRAAGTVLKVAEDKTKIRELFGKSPDEFESALIGWSRGTQKPGFATISDLSQLNRRLL